MERFSASGCRALLIRHILPLLPEFLSILTNNTEFCVNLSFLFDSAIAMSYIARAGRVFLLLLVQLLLSLLPFVARSEAH